MSKAPLGPLKIAATLVHYTPQYRSVEWSTQHTIAIPRAVAVIGISLQVVLLDQYK